MIENIRNEPVAFFAAVMAALMAGVGLAVTFGVELSSEHILAIEGFSAALFGVPIFILTRSQVTPTIKVEDIPVDAPGPPSPTTTVGDILEDK